MKYEFYDQLQIADDYSIFDFVSEGKNGIIDKRIEFTPTEIPEIVNLAFGDITNEGEINDYSISNNGDRNKVLSTVAFAVEVYLNKYPNRVIYFKGSTEERTRLYRMAIGINFEELCLKFDIYSEQPDGFAPFQKNTPALGILVKKKIT